MRERERERESESVREEVKQNHSNPGRASFGTCAASGSLVHRTYFIITAVARMVSTLLGCTSQYSLVDKLPCPSAWHPRTCHCKMLLKTSPKQTM